MRQHNGTQLYGIQKILTTLKMGMNKELRKLSLRQKLATLEILEECPSYNEKRLPEFYKRMRFRS